LAQDFVALQHFVAAEHEFGEIDYAFALADFVVFAFGVKGGGATTRIGNGSTARAGRPGLAPAPPAKRIIHCPMRELRGEQMRWL